MKRGFCNNIDGYSDEEMTCCACISCSSKVEACLVYMQAMSVSEIYYANYGHMVKIILKITIARMNG